MKRIVICADDYGQNSQISQAIVNLFEINRLTATSCLVTSLEWPSFSKQLDRFKGQVDLGLHFNLTEGAPLSTAFSKTYGMQFPSLSSLILGSYLRRFDRDIIKQELMAQLERFISHTGQMPHFIDGHQHIHQLPGVREALLDLWQQQLKNDRVYIRSTYKAVYSQAVIKSLIIQACGAKKLRDSLINNQVPHNVSFGGIYDFSLSLPYSKHFKTFLFGLSDKGLLMCHPGLVSNDPADVIAKARFNEYQYFASEQFLDDCKANNVVLSSGLFV